MDKVDFSLTSLINPALQQKTGAKKPESSPKTRRKTFFSDMLESSVRESGGLGPIMRLPPSEEALTELMDAVHSAGSDLIDRPFHDEILQYKKAVRNFVNYVLENTFAIERTQTRRRGKLKIHVQIQVIDRKLEELAAAILSGQTQQLERVSKLDEIKGLLVDLTITGAIKERDD
jgi:uncharacterized protein YaaR (DUF327 family)